jgi:hypothetical protein
LKRALFFDAAGAVLKIGLRLKPNHHWEILLAKSVKRSVQVTFSTPFIHRQVTLF